MSQQETEYMLSRTAQERQRLIQQSKFLDPFTRALLVASGLRPGMRVLDLGCGVGDVSFLAASFVGPTGEVVGIDRDPASVDLARARALESGFTNVSFRVEDVTQLNDDACFDAVVARMVLAHLADPVDVLRRAARAVKPGGLVIAQEADYYTLHSEPHVPLWHEISGWVLETGRRAGANPHMGTHLYSTFVAAGLNPPQLRMDSLIVGGHDPEPFDLIVNSFRSILPAIVKFGVATEEQVQIDTLKDRLMQAVRAGGVL